MVPISPNIVVPRQNTYAKELLCPIFFLNMSATSQLKTLNHGLCWELENLVS